MSENTIVKTIESASEMQSFSNKLIREGKSIAFVPTMGALHEGHISLMREGKKRADVLISSIFVNPTQFGPGEDYKKYKRDVEGDLKKVCKAGVDVVFLPAVETVYPEGFQTYVEVSELSKPLCGQFRPGHFRGVASVVLKLFNIVKPNIAVFGRKDYQQLKIIQKMVADLNLDIDVVGMPIIRDESGLAMSSRNEYLTKEEKEQALALSRALNEIKRNFDSGHTDVGQLTAIGQKILTDANISEVDYLEIRDGETLGQRDTALTGDVVAVAAKVGKARLIDNMSL